MRRFLFLVILLMPLAACAAPQTGASADFNAIYACKADEDCIVAEAPCPFSWTGINKDYKTQQEELVAKMRPLIKCFVGDTGKPKPEKAVCAEHQCRIP